MAADLNPHQRFEIGPFTVIPSRRIVRRDGKDVHIEPKQMEALFTLARHQPDVVSKDQLVNEVWGGRATADESVVQCIKGVRHVLDNDSPRNPKYIETIHGRGYRLIVPVRVSKTETSSHGRVQMARFWMPAAVLVVAALVIAIVLMPDSAPEPIDSVVITVFDNISTEADPSIAAGFTGQLISTLHQLPDFKVKKGSLLATSESDEDVVARFGVDSVVRGSVQQHNNELEITARFVDSDGVNLWADTFTGTVDDLFSLHEQVAKKVRVAIGDKTEEPFSALSKPTSTDAYLKYLLGQSFLDKRDVSSLQKAAETFLNSIELDPKFGPAYLSLANTYVLLADYGAQNVMFDQAVAIVGEGIAQDPSILEAAQTYTGYVQTKRGDWLAATALFQTATSSTTEYPPAQHYYSRLMAAVGRLDDSLAAAQIAWDLDRDKQVLNSRMAIAHFWKNEMEQAGQFYEIANAKNVGAPIHLMSYALFLMRSGQVEDAREVARNAMQLHKFNSDWVDPVFDELSISPTSESTASVLERYSESTEIPATVLVTLWSIAGRADRAMDIAWNLIDDANYFDIELIYLDEFRILRQHPDFPRLLDEIGLTEYWQITGCHWDNDGGICI